MMIMYSTNNIIKTVKTNDQFLMNSRYSASNNYNKRIPRLNYVFLLKFTGSISPIVKSS